MLFLLEQSRVRYVNEEDFFEDERVFRNINRAAEYDDIVTGDAL